MSSNGVFCTIMTLILLDTPKINFKKITPSEPAVLLGFIVCDIILLSLFSSKPFLFHKWRAMFVLSL